MKCANCPQHPKFRCEKEGFDCTGGSLDLSPYQQEPEKSWHRISMDMIHEVGNTMNRLEEIIEFCQRMKYEKVGIAFCIALSKEAEALSNILKQYFTVNSVCCKICGMPKKDFNCGNVSSDPEKFEAMCNPVGQAKMLNRNGSDLNIEVGLCLGHDLLFQKYSDAPVTVFAVKDRVMAHNPLGVLYSSFYKRHFDKKE